MLNKKLAGAVVAGLLFGAGAVNAAGPSFAASTNETASSPHAYQGAVRTDATAGVARSSLPASQNETASSPHAYQRDAKPAQADVTQGNRGSAFPVSYSEVA